MSKSENAQQVEDFLRGYLQADAEQSQRMIERTNWRDLAQIELERRVSRFLGVLPDELLLAVACGEVDVENLVVRLQNR